MRTNTPDPQDKTTNIVRQNLKIACVMRDMSQTAVSRAAGLSRNTVSQFTAGTTQISHRNILKVCEVLRIPISVLHMEDGVTYARIRLYTRIEAMEDYLVNELLEKIDAEKA